MSDIVVVETPAPAVQIIESTEQVAQVVNVLQAGPQGIPGVKGDKGDSFTDSIWLDTAIDMGGHKAVAPNGDATVKYADHQTAYQGVLGITITAALQGNSINIICSGPIIELTWNWTPNQYIYLGSNGALTQTAPTSGAIVILGYAISQTEMFVKIQQPIVLA